MASGLDELDDSAFRDAKTSSEITAGSASEIVGDQLLALSFCQSCLGTMRRSDWRGWSGAVMVASTELRADDLKSFSVTWTTPVRLYEVHFRDRV